MTPGSHLRRRAVRHLLLFGASTAMVLFVYLNVPTDFILRRWNLATAYTALAWLALTLLIGPWNRLRSRPNPVSIELRRDIGIWAAIVSVIHSLIGLQIHFGGDVARYFVYGPDEPHLFPIRLDAIGLANYTGLGSTLILLLLLGLSNDLLLRRLGTRRWKRLQRANYIAFGLMVVHAIIYQVVEKRVLPVAAVFVGTTAVVVAAQAVGIWHTRRSS